MDSKAAVEQSLPVFAEVPPGNWAALHVGVLAAGVPEPAASEVLAFVPIAFGRALMDGMGVRFSPEYATPDGRVAPLAGHPVYAAAAATAADMMARQVGGEEFVAVAVWSSEFSAVNQALNAGSNPADLEAGPPLLTTLAPAAAGGSPQPRVGASPRAASDAKPAGKPWWKFWG